MAELSITAISDTHSRVALPDLLKGCESDILIHCGDFTAGRTNHLSKSIIHNSHRQSWKWFLHELSLIRDQFRSIIVVPGNHDQICECMPEQCQSEMEKIGVHLLMNDGVILFEDSETSTVKVWGLPHTPPFGPWFFQGDDMSTYTDNIPDATNVIVCHDPPYSILDTIDIRSNNHLGSHDLYNRCLELLDLKAVFFGHIHSAHGEYHRLGVDYFNCSILDERYERRYDPVKVKIKIDGSVFNPIVSD